MTRRTLYPGPKVLRMPSGAGLKLAREMRFSWRRWLWAGQHEITTHAAGLNRQAAALFGGARNMSKQSEAKQRQRQGYVDKMLPQTCGNCLQYRSDFVTREHAFGEWTDEKNRRCGIGEFSVKKNGTCRLWQAKQP